MLRVILLFISVCIIWGTTWLAMAIAVDSIPPIFATSLRFFIASPLLLMLCTYKNQPLFPKGDRGWIILISIFYFAIPFTLMIYGETYISSGLAAIIFSIMPIAVMIICIITRVMRISKRQYIGVFIATLGVIMIMMNEMSINGENYFIGISALSIAVLLHAVMYVNINRKCNISVLTYNTIPSIIASILLLITSLSYETIIIDNIYLLSLLAVLYLGIVASVGGVLSYFYLNKISDPFTASFCFIIFPLVAIILSTYFENKELQPTSLMFTFILILGIIIAKYPTKKL